MSNGQKTIRVRRGDVEVEVSGTDTFIDRHLQDLLGKFLPVAKALRDTLKGEKEKGEPSDHAGFGDFFDKKDPKDGKDKALVAIYWLKVKERVSPVTVSEVDEVLNIMDVELSNTNTTLKRLVGKRLAAKAGKKDRRNAFRLLEKGNKRVEEELPLAEAKKS